MELHVGSELKRGDADTGAQKAAREHWAGVVGRRLSSHGSRNWGSDRVSSGFLEKHGHSK